MISCTNNSAVRAKLLGAFLLLMSIDMATRELPWNYMPECATATATATTRCLLHFLYHYCVYCSGFALGYDRNAYMCIIAKKLSFA